MSKEVGSDELVLFGTKGGPSIRAMGPSTMPTSSCLDIGGRFRIIVDCGLGVTRALRESGRAVDSITHIFLTHYHSDHILELGGLLSTAWCCGLQHTVHLFGPQGLQEVWDGFCGMLAYDLQVRQEDEGRPDLRSLVQLHVHGAGEILRDGELVVWAHKNLHPPVDESYALRFDYGGDCDGRSVFFSGDTTYFPPLAQFARGCAVVVHEALLESGVDFVCDATGNTDQRLRRHLLQAHTTARDAGRVAGEAGAALLVLHHLIPPERDVAPDEQWLREARSDHPELNVLVGYDGMVVPFGDSLGPGESAPAADAGAGVKQEEEGGGSVTVTVGDVLQRLVEAARQSQQFQRGRAFHGLSLAQYEQFCAYALLVLLGAKRAYLVDNMSFGRCKDCSRDCTAGRRVGKKKVKVLPAQACVTLLLRGVQAALERHAGPDGVAALVCLSVEAAHGEGEGRGEAGWSTPALDFLILRRDVYLRGLEDARLCASGNGARVPLLVDVGPGSEVPTEVGAAQAQRLLSSMVDALPSAEALLADPQLCQLLQLSAPGGALVRGSCGFCFLFGWFLGYACVYANGAQFQGSGDGDCLGSNCLSMQPLRLSRLTVPTDAFLGLALAPSGRERGKLARKPNVPKGQPAARPSGGFLRSATQLTIFDLTAPAALLAEAGGEGTGARLYGGALESQAEAVRQLFGSADLASSTVQLPAVMM